MRIDIWSDVVCPWCSVGRARFGRALEAFGHRDEVEVVWRSYELDPGAEHSGTRDLPQAQLLAEKYGRTPEQAQEMLDQMAATAAADGLDFRFDRVRGGNTFDAHRLLQLARERGVQHEVKGALDVATFRDGLSVSDHDQLTAAVVAAGLDEAEARSVLAGDAYAADVRGDEQEARALGITGVPFFVLDGRFAISGAQPTEHVTQVLEHAWAERSPLTVLSGDDAAGACEGDSCTV